MRLATSCASCVGRDGGAIPVSPLIAVRTCGGVAGAPVDIVSVARYLVERQGYSLSLCVPGAPCFRPLVVGQTIIDFRVQSLARGATCLPDVIVESEDVEIP